MSPSNTIERFIAEHRLPADFAHLARRYYLPLLAWILDRKDGRAPFLLGINGAQGTGKSTLADFLRTAFETEHGWRVAVLSIDDFYRTRQEREQLAACVHRLFATRGVPGTHDTALLADCLSDLRQLRAGETVALPRFNKASDDRCDSADWPTVAGPVDLIVLEGWCVGSVPQRSDELVDPVNRLEHDEDADGVWRRHANERLAADYMPIFSELDALLFLRAPSFDAIYRWRLEQEQKLAERSSANAPGLMTEQQIARFIQHYERLTRANLQNIPASAEVVFELDEDHNFTNARYRD